MIITVVGLGVVGGSFVKALKGQGHEVYGVDINEETLARAKADGCIKEGFVNGDEIIKFTAKVITKYVHNLENSDNFIGHIGGDDFVAIVSKTDYDKICQEIIIEFDTEVENFYTDTDVARGYVEIENRRGVLEQFPLTTISIAVVEVDPEIFKSPLEIGEVGAQVKHRAKAIMGSAYVINKRKH